jgi:hypothetical protein
VFYGVYEDGVERIAMVVPDVTITTLDGVEIIPPCFDPEGQYLYGFQRNMQRTDDVASLLNQMQDAQAKLQAEIDELRTAQAQREIHGNNDGELPEDNPRLP